MHHDLQAAKNFAAILSCLRPLAKVANCTYLTQDSRILRQLCLRRFFLDTRMSYYVANEVMTET